MTDENTKALDMLVNKIVSIVETKNQITVSDHVNQEHYDSHEEGNRKESSLNDIKVEDDKSKKEEETVTLQNENHIEQEINPTEETEHNNKIEVGREENNRNQS